MGTYLNRQGNPLILACMIVLVATLENYCYEEEDDACALDPTPK